MNIRSILLVFAVCCNFFVQNAYSQELHTISLYDFLDKKLYFQYDRNYGQVSLIVESQNKTQNENSLLNSLGLQFVNRIEINKEVWLFHPALFAANINRWGSLAREYKDFLGSTTVYIHTPQKKINCDSSLWLSARLYRIEGFCLNYAYFKKYLNAIVISKIDSNQFGFSFFGDRDPLLKIADLPQVFFLELANTKAVPLNTVSGELARSRFVSYYRNKNLLGQNVVLGIGEVNFPRPHLDFQNRLVGIDTQFYAPYESHATMVCGTAIGGGILNEYTTGIATKSKANYAYASNIIAYSETLFKTTGMVITNNSYSMPPPPSFISSCATMGSYNFDCRYIDNIICKLKFQNHVVAAGNSGATNCSPYPTGFGTIAEGYQSAKNCITVGYVDAVDVIHGGSSRGPTRDGRIKPDLVARGLSVASSGPNNTVSIGTGSSHSAPQVAAILALLTQRYRELNSNQNPKAALLKCILLNSATDLGNIGPDYTYGFGRVNAKRAVECLENANYFSNTINSGDSQSFSINVPSNSGELKVTLYWNDTAGSQLSAQNLVNNLDLVVIDNLGNRILPWKTDTTKSLVNSAAIRGKDNINNAEQVSISLPSAGTYVIKIFGNSMLYNNQEYFVSYESKQRGVEIIAPHPGEVLISGLGSGIAIDQCGINTGTYSIFASTDSGASWSTLTTTHPASSNYYAGYTAPSSANKRLLLRIAHNSLAFYDTMNGVYASIGRPNILTITSCGKNVNLTWSSVSGATQYEILRLAGTEWKTVFFTTATNAKVPAFANAGIEEWYVVRAKAVGISGQRGNASKVTISSSVCSGSADLSIEKLLWPVGGRQFTSYKLSTNQNFRILRRNAGGTNIVSATALSQIRFNGSSNAGTHSVSLNSNDTNSRNFTSTFDLSSIGKYQLRFINSISDANAANDTMDVELQHLANAAIVLPHLTNFESAKDSTYIGSAFGAAGESRLDFTSSTGKGRMRLQPGPLLCKGNGGIGLDMINPNGTFNQNFAILTYNMSTYTSSKVLLSFEYRLTGEASHSGDSLWIRGADTQRWIPVYHLADAAAKNGFITVSDINVSGILSANAQPFGTSFQLRFGQYDNKRNRSLVDSAGIFIDNIYFSEATTDVKLNYIIGPKTRCGWGSDSVKISFTNLGISSLSQIPFAYQLNQNSIVFDTLKTSTSSGQTRQFSFAIPINISNSAFQKIKIWSSLSNDNNKTNDTLELQQFKFIETISQFPFLDDFEKPAQKFYSQGIENSWEWGTPANSFNTTAASGSSCWSSGLKDFYKHNQTSYLYSPCFNLSGLDTAAKLSFNSKHQTEANFDGYFLQWSEDQTNWTTIGSSGYKFNWYTPSAPYFWWQGNRNSWKVNGLALPLSSLSNKTKVQFRFVMVSDGNLNFGGAHIDDFHLFDGSTGVYRGTTQTFSATGTGAGWVHIKNNNQNILSLSDSGNSIGNFTAGVHVLTGTHRQYNGQYTMNRNWWVLPNGAGSGNFRTRLYFTETEAENFAAIDPIATDFRQFGVTKYRGIREDSLFQNDTFLNSAYTYFSSPNKIVPFFNGQYLEILHTNFSEFWINTGTLSNAIPLNMGEILLQMQDNNSQNILMVNSTGMTCAMGNYNLQRSDDFLNSWNNIKHRKTTSCNETQFFLIDSIQDRKQTLYYRIEYTSPIGYKIYSNMVYSNRKLNTSVTIYPNPSQNILHIQLPKSLQKIEAELFDIQGKKCVHEFLQNASPKKQFLLPLKLQKGLYIIKLHYGSEVHVEKILIE